MRLIHHFSTALFAFVLLPTHLMAEDIFQVWSSDLVSDKAIHEVGRAWWKEDSVQFNALSNGTAEWTTRCQWDSPRQPPFAGGNNYMNNSVVSLGSRAITPRSVKYRTLQGMQNQKDDLVYSNAFQSFDEVLRQFPNRAGKLQIHVQGTVDRCENPNGPSIRQTGLMTNSIRFTLRCNNADEFASPSSGLMTNAPGIWRSRVYIWTSNSQDAFPDPESLAFDQTIYIPFDTTSCDSEMFLTAELPTAQRLTFTTLETVLWSN